MSDDTTDPIDCDNAAYCMSLVAENRKLKAEVEDLLDIVAESIAQSCTVEDGTLDSLALSTYAEAIRLLARRGRVTIEHEYGRRVIARWTVVESQNESS